MSPTGDNGCLALPNGSTFPDLASSLMAMPSLEPGNWDKALWFSRRWAAWGSQGPVCSLHLGQFLSEEPGLKALRT